MKELSDIEIENNEAYAQGVEEGQNVGAVGFLMHTIGGFSPLSMLSDERGKELQDIHEKGYQEGYFSK
jgi:hypothetical protein